MSKKLLVKKYTRKPTLLFYTNVDWSFVSHRLDLAKEAILDGYEVHLSSNITNSKDIIEKNGIFLHESYLSRRFHLFRDFYAIIKLIILIFKIKPKIIHNVSNKNIIIGGVVARIFKIKKIILAVSGLGYIYINKNLFTYIIKKIINLAYTIILKYKNSFVIVQNESDYNFISNIIKDDKKLKRIILIPGSGVDTDHFKPVEKSGNKIVVSIVARMLYDKGVNEFVQAAKILNKKYDKVEFNLYGEPDHGNPKSIPLIELNKWNLFKNINWKGHVKDSLSIYNNSDIIVLPSYREGMPKAILEASSCGKPSIVTNVPGCRDSIIPNKTGLLVKLYDIDDLVKKIEILITNDELRKSMGIEARKLALMKFNIKKINLQQLKIYRK